MRMVRELVWTSWRPVSRGFRAIELRGDRPESVGHLAPFLAPDGSARITAIGDGAVADGGDANRPPAVSELVEDAVRTDSQRVQAAEPPAERVPCLRVALQQPQGVLDRVDQRPAELEQFAARAPGEDESRQPSAGGRTTLCQLGAKLGDGDRLPALNLGEARLQRGEGPRVGKNLGRLL